MYFPKSITLVGASYCFDGGTTTLTAVTESNQLCHIVLTQRMFANHSHPGRLFFDEYLIPVRSDEESIVLTLLRSASVRIPKGQVEATESLENAPSPIYLDVEIKNVLDGPPADSLSRHRDSIVAFVESDEYLDIFINGAPIRYE